MATCLIEVDVDGLLLLEELLCAKIGIQLAQNLDTEVAQALLSEVQNGLGNLSDQEGKDYHDMTEAELAEVKGRFKVGDSPTEFDNLLAAVNECVYLAEKNTCRVYVYEWVDGDWQPCWDEDERIV